MKKVSIALSIPLIIASAIAYPQITFKENSRIFECADAVFSVPNTALWSARENNGVCSISFQGASTFSSSELGQDISEFFENFGGSTISAEKDFLIKESFFRLISSRLFSAAANDEHEASEILDFFEAFEAPRDLQEKLATCYSQNQTITVFDKKFVIGDEEFNSILCKYIEPDTTNVSTWIRPSGGILYTMKGELRSQSVESLNFYAFFPVRVK